LKSFRAHASRCLRGGTSLRYHVTPGTIFSGISQGAVSASLWAIRVECALYSVSSRQHTAGGQIITSRRCTPWSTRRILYMCSTPHGLHDTVRFPSCFAAWRATRTRTCCAQRPSTTPVRWCRFCCPSPTTTWRPFSSRTRASWIGWGR